VNSLFETITERCEDCSEFREVIIGIDDFGCDRSYRYCNLKKYYDFVSINETPDKNGCKKEK
jgi:hypothetical protein